MTPLIFVHGWGLDPGLWSAVTAHLDGIKRHMANLGFRGVPRFPSVTRPIVVGHSMGFGWALENIPQPWSYAVAINGFTRFARADDFPEGVDQRILTRMRTRLAVDAPAVCADFLARAGLYNPMTADLDASALGRHLDWLARMDMRDRLAALDCPVLALCGAKDAIVPPALSASCFSAAQLEWIEDGDHMAPVKNAALIVSRLRRLSAGE